MVRKKDYSSYKHKESTDLKVKLNEIYDDFHTILLDSHSIYSNENQVRVHADYLEFALGLPDILKNKDIDLFKTYIKESYDKGLVSKSFFDRWYECNDYNFTWFSNIFLNNSSFYTLPIQCGNGFQISIKTRKDVGLYFNLTSRKQKISKIKANFISYICSGTKSQWINHYHINKIAQISNELFLFSEKCKIQNLILRFDRNLTIESVKTLREYKDIEEIKNIFKCMQHRLRFMVYIKNKESVLSNEFNCSSKFNKLHKIYLKSVDEEMKESIELSLCKIEEQVVKASTRKLKTKKNNYNLIEGRCLRINNKNKPIVILLSDEAIFFIKTQTGWTKTLGNFERLVKNSKDIETDVDFISEVHKELNKELRKLNKNYEINYDKIVELNQQYITLCFIFPHYKDEIIICSRTGECFKTLIRKRNINEKLCYIS